MLLPLMLAAIRFYFQSGDQKQIHDFKRSIFKIDGCQSTLGGISQHFWMENGKPLSVTQTNIEGDERAGGMNFV